MVVHIGPERVCRRVLLASILTTTTAMVLPVQSAWADGAGVPMAETLLAQANDTFTFDLPAKPLAQALIDVGRITGLSILYTQEDTNALTSPVLAGKMTAEQALRTVLAGSGYSYRFTNARTVTLVRVQGQGAANGAIALDPVAVEGANVRERALGPVAGYVATRSATATKTDTPLVDTPQSISVITREQMQDRAVQTIPQAVAYTAGVTTGAFGYDPRFDQIYVRGFEVHGSSDYRDGLRQLSSGMTYFRTDPYTLERVEVLKGPSSILFGQGSPGGLINRVTKRPTETAQYEVEGQIGTDDRFQGAFDLGGPVDDNRNILYRVTGLARDSDTDVKGGQDDRQLIAPAVTLRNESTSVTLLSHYQKDKTDANVVHFQGLGELTRIRASDPDFDEFAQEQYQIGYGAEHKFNDSLAIRQNLRYGHIDLDLTYMYINGLLGGTQWDRVADRMVQSMDAFTVDNQVEGKFATGPVQHTLIGGLDYQQLDQQQERGFGAASPLDISNPVYGVATGLPRLTIRTNVDMEQLGAYAQDQMTIADKWHAVVGLRKDWADRSQRNLITNIKTSEKKDDAMTGRAGLLYHSDSGLAPYASYSTSFLPNTNTGVDGGILKATTAEQYETGIKYQPQGINSFATLSVFHLTQQNVAKLIPSTFVYSQTGEVRSRGVELEGVADLSNGLKMTAAYTYVDAKVTNSTQASELGQRPMLTPTHTASLWADYTRQSGSLAGAGGGLGARFIGDSYGDAANTVQNDAYVQVDAGVHYDLDSLRLALNVNNVFDKEVKTYNDGFLYWGLGRTVIGSVKYRW